MYTKRPTKQELYNRIAELERLQQKAYEEKNREKIKIWNDLLPRAYEVCRAQLRGIFPNLLCALHFEHVDEGGYWFTFELINDGRRQTHAIRHYEINAPTVETVTTLFDSDLEEYEHTNGNQ
jgi:hypothetical protein